MSGGTLGTWLRTWRRQAARRRATEGWWVDLWEALGPLLIAALVTPLFRPVFLGYLAMPVERWSEGTEGVLQRLVLLLGGWMALEAHQVVLRTGDRAVLSALPLEPAGVVVYELIRLASLRWWMVPAAGILLSPLLVVAPSLWVMAVGVLFSVQLAALVGGAVGALLAIEVAERPSWAPLLDAVRGQNPKLQAALLWAPGLVLIAIGLAGALSIAGASAVVGGSAVGAAGVAVPVGLAAAFAAMLPRLARRAWFRGTPLLQEIDARYALLERPEDARRVYLDWAVRFFPAAARPWALADLRHGWRVRRSWITSTWVGGAAAAVASWSADPASVATAAAVAAVTAWACGGISGWMDRDIPAFTKVMLPDRAAVRVAARALVLFAWLQPVAWMPVFPVLVRQGAGPAAGILLFTQASIAIVAVVCPVLGRLGLGLIGYAPIAAFGSGLAVAIGSRLWVSR